VPTHRLLQFFNYASQLSILRFVVRNQCADGFLKFYEQRYFADMKHGLEQKDQLQAEVILPQVVLCFENQGLLHLLFFFATGDFVFNYFLRVHQIFKHRDSFFRPVHGLALVIISLVFLFHLESHKNGCFSGTLQRFGLLGDDPSDDVGVVGGQIELFGGLHKQFSVDFIEHGKEFVFEVGGSVDRVFLANEQIGGDFAQLVEQNVLVAHEGLLLRVEVGQNQLL